MRFTVRRQRYRCGHLACRTIATWKVYMQKYVFAGGTAVITGAASGIGDAWHTRSLGVAAIWFCLTEMPSG
jgi:hypothetical protein